MSNFLGTPHLYPIEFLAWEYSWGIRGVFVGYSWGIRMYRVCIGKVSKEKKSGGGSRMGTEGTET